MEIYYLLFYLSEDYSDDDVEALREFVSNLGAARKWTLGTPGFVDQIEDIDATAPEDVPIRTAGGVLDLYKSTEDLPATIDREMYHDVEYLVGELTKFSAENGCSFELELGGELVGSIEEGVADDATRVGLLECWRKGLGDANH
jgi:hypothetical protein